MRDAEIRAALLTSLVSANGDETRIVQEMGIWSGSVRIDVAVINGQLHGYELKSARDTLYRLGDQAALYNEVFDRVTLVTAEKHYYKAAQKIPQWWGISIAVAEKDGSVSVRESRKSKLNKHVIPLQVARLLWRSELLELLKAHGIDRGVRGGTVDAMAERLVERLAATRVRQEVREILKRRASWLGQPVGNQA